MWTGWKHGCHGGSREELQVGHRRVPVSALHEEDEAGDVGFSPEELLLQANHVSSLPAFHPVFRVDNSTPWLLLR